MSVAQGVGLKLQSFSPTLARQQAQALCPLVERNAAWLNESPHAADVRHYGATAVHATLHIARSANVLGRSEAFPYVISHASGENYGMPGTALGLARVVRQQQVWHPDSGAHARGVFVDYWLDAQAGQDKDLHTAVADALLQHATVIGGSSQDGGVAFTTIDPHAENQPVGFQAIMSAMDGPSPLQISPAARRDPYGMLRGGYTVQLYTHPLGGPAT